MERENRKTGVFLPRLLLTGAGIGLWLFTFLFFTFPEEKENFSSRGLTPLRQGKILFTLQERLEVARLLNTQRRNESSSQNKRERSNDPFSGTLPPPMDVPYAAGGNEAFHQPGFLKITLHATNPVRAGPSFFS